MRTSARAEAAESNATKNPTVSRALFTAVAPATDLETKRAFIKVYSEPTTGTSRPKGRFPTWDESVLLSDEGPLRDFQSWPRVKIIDRRSHFSRAAQRERNVALSTECPRR